MLVSELLATIKASEGYITNSLHLKSNDDFGGAYKYLVQEGLFGKRKEIFIAAEGTGDFAVRTVITSIEVYPAD